jgi:glycosyltransferase involved in cell wall biosynthesis
MLQKICLISSGQPSANPRLVKEAITLVEAGYNVSVIFCQLSPWADEYDHNLFTIYPQISWIRVGIHSLKKPKLYRILCLRKKMYTYIFRYLGISHYTAERSLVLYSQELTSAACKIKADLYIGHNIGALPALVKASCKYNVNSIFDFEDYHRGELDSNSLYSSMIIDVENRYIPYVTSMTTASPAITQAYGSIFPKKIIKTINNCFPLLYAIQDTNPNPQLPLKLFWFSQYVGRQRGLETVLKAMSFFRVEEITLTLLGSASKNIKQYFYNLLKSYNLKTEQLVFLDTVSEEKIASIASMHHIGLASEFAHNQNRNLCLTNKLFMYLLAGNAILATDTSAQKYFLEENQGIGSLYEQENSNDLFRVLKNYIDNPELLDTQRKNALQLGKDKYNWDIEQDQFLQNVEKYLPR